MNQLILAASIGLCVSLSINLVASTDPRERRDWPEHALALARRITYNDSGCEFSGRRSAGGPADAAGSPIIDHHKIPSVSGQPSLMGCGQRSAAVTFFLRILNPPLQMRADKPVGLRE